MCLHGDFGCEPLACFACVAGLASCAFASGLRVRCRAGAASGLGCRTPSMPVRGLLVIAPWLVAACLGAALPTCRDGAVPARA
eukprot:6875071-Prymnesium_polylepis.1